MADMLAPIIRPLIRPLVRDITDWSGVSLSVQVAAMFASGEQGAWYDPSNMASLFQDSAGTMPVTAVGQPVGRILDQSGRGNNQTQATTSARPLYKVDSGVYNLKFDGIDDGLSTAAFATGTLTSNMDCFIAIRRDSSAGVLLAAPATGGASWFGVMDTSASAASNGSGTPTYAANGVDVPGGTATTRAQLNAAVPVGQWAIVEIRNLDLSSWTAFLMGNYSGFLLNAGIGGVILWPANASARPTARKYLGQKVGLSL